MFRRTVATALGAIVLLLASCAADAGVPPTTADTAKAEISPTASAAPAAFSEREPLPSCGEFRLGQGERYPDDAMKCLEDAIGAGGAELIVTKLTVEGDPIVTWFRALPTGGMETWTDVREDKFAGEGVSWRYRLCPSAYSPLGDLGECTSESFNEHPG